MIAPVEGLETTAEERAHWASVLANGPNWLAGEQSARLLRDVATLTARLAVAEKELRAMSHNYHVLLRVGEELAHKREALETALRELVESLVDQDEEGLIEHAEPMRRARDLLSPSGNGEGA